MISEVKAKVKRHSNRVAMGWRGASFFKSDATRCLIITGADPTFCSGDDVRRVMVALGERPAGRAVEPRLACAAEAILHSDVPIIAAVNSVVVVVEKGLFAQT